LVRERVPFIYEYQGFEAFGEQILRATVGRYPVTAIESLFKRLFILLVKLPILAQPLTAQSPWFVRTSQLAAIGTLVLAVLALGSCAVIDWSCSFPVERFGTRCHALVTHASSTTRLGFCKCWFSRQRWC
jgi:hypothetical protein